MQKYNVLLQKYDEGNLQIVSEWLPNFHMR